MKSILCVLCAVMAAIGTGLSGSGPAWAGTSAFTGRIYTPERGETTVVIRGDLTVAASDCPESIGDYDLSKPYGYPNLVSFGLMEGSELSATWENSAKGQYINSPDGTRYVELTLYGVAPGNYAFVVAGFYERVQGEGYKWVVCSRLSPVEILVTKAKSTELVATAATTTISQGESVAVTLQEVTTWSDGVSTQKTPSGNNFTFQSRRIGTIDWMGTSGQPTTVRVSPAYSSEYRFLQDGRPSRSISITVIGPTSARKIIGTSVAPSSGVVGTTLLIQAAMTSQFSDGTWQASPPGTPFVIQFFPDYGSAWEPVFSGTIVDAGAVLHYTTLERPGRYRIVAGTAFGDEVTVALIGPTGDLLLGALALPKSVKRLSQMTISVAASVAYSDGLPRPVPSGTPFSAEFAASDRPRSQTDVQSQALRWSTIRTGAATSPGILSLRVKAAKSGYWRVRLGGETTTPVFVRVGGR
jgi:hypothetical protein